MKALFVHDHKFPYKDGVYYHSYGFDEEFFNRYLMIFDELEIVGRNSMLNQGEEQTPKVSEYVKFFTLSNYKQLKSYETRRGIDQKIIDSDFLVVRLPSVIGLYAIQRARKIGKPYLVEVVGSAWDSLWYQGPSKKVSAPIMSVLCKKAIRNAKYVVYVTENYLQEQYPTLGKSIACSNVTLPYVDEQTITKRLEKINNTNLNKKIILGTCATLNIYKGQQHVIEAISKLKEQGYNIQYQLVGGGDPSYLKSLANKYGVVDKVKFYGKLKHSDVFSWLDSIDVYIQPSLTEGLPRSVVEALSRGCTVVGSNAGGIPELINKELVFDKGNINSICKILENLSLDIMRDQAVTNHETSKKYLKSILYKRRVDFFKEFIKTWEG